MVEAHSLERGYHSLSSLQLNDPQRTNFRDKDRKPVMDCLGTTAALKYIWYLKNEGDVCYKF